MKAGDFALFTEQQKTVEQQKRASACGRCNAVDSWETATRSGAQALEAILPAATGELDLNGHAPYWFFGTEVILTRQRQIIA